MYEKLRQMNTVIESILQYMVKEAAGAYEDALLIVMGDHGQTLYGDHGGGTAPEVRI